MTGQDRLLGRYWPTRSHLVVVTGEPELVAQWFDAVREHHEACRDLVDLWDEAGRGGDVALALAEAMGRMRHTLWAVRQWDVER